MTTSQLLPDYFLKQYPEYNEAKLDHRKVHTAFAAFLGVERMDIEDRDYILRDIDPRDIHVDSKLSKLQLTGMLQQQIAFSETLKHHINDLDKMLDKKAGLLRQAETYLKELEKK